MPDNKLKRAVRRAMLTLLADDAYKTERKRLLDEIKLRKEKAALAREQRDQARAQRDDAREQRAEARRQRKDAALAVKQMQSRLSKAGGGLSKKTNYLKEFQDSYNRFLAEKEKNPSLENVSLAVSEMEHGVEAPYFSNVYPQRNTPPESLAFVTVANNLFMPGLEVLIASLLDVYPDFNSDVIVFHDGTISEFSMRRMQNMYARIKFEEPDMTWLTDIPQDSGNRKRIGILGYMSVMALEKQQYERIVVLDSDTAIVDDISMLWTGVDIPLGSQQTPPPIEPDTIFTCQDYGARPWAAISPGTGKPIINSGILSVPRRYFTESDVEDIKQLVVANHEEFCPLLDRFADQKAWNRFIYARDMNVLPINFNCNIKFLDKNRGGDVSFVRMIHFAGYKPWFDKNYIDGDMIPESDAAAVRPGVWRELNTRYLGRLRQRQFQEEITQPNYFNMIESPREIDGKPTCVFIGNGPSLQNTDLSKFDGFETFAFNWFVLHDDFDTIRPTHLVLGSHMFFGGWQTQTPTIPPEYIEALREKTWRPQIWTSFYFKEYFDTWELAGEFDVRYVLFEKPHKDFIDTTGTTNLNVDGFTHDGRTGVLSVALPVAVRQGYKNIGLVGCDSNYNQNANAESNYFYDAAKHVSKETRQTSLTQTWVNDGPGFFAYTRAQKSLERRNGSFIDYTLNGALPLPKGDLETL